MKKRVATPSQKEAKRQHLLTIAAAEFAQRGFDEANINVIADKAEVGKGTMYRYFADKEQLFVEVLNEIAFHTLEAFTVALADTEGQPVVARLEAIFQAVVLLKQKYPDFITVQRSAAYGNSSHKQFEVVTAQMVRTLTDEFEHIFQREIDAGRIRSLHARRIAVFFVTQIHTFRRVAELLGEEGPTPGPFIADLLWNGLKPD